MELTKWGKNGRIKRCLDALEKYGPAAKSLLPKLKQLEKNYTVRANHLPSGFPTNAKMRAQLIDWLVEVQVQFKLTQETFFRTVHTIDR